jgi:GPH family glycoside/pentoside/hexuronide:cation symporter
MSAAHHIPEQDRIPLLQKVMFSLGQNTDYVATGLMTTVMWMPYFNLGIGLSPVVLGVILMILRAWDAITDPLMGNISDNARTRWGRRRPFMFVGAITTATLYPLVWHFPASVMDGTSALGVVVDWIPFSASFGLTAAEKCMAVYLTLVGLVFFTSFTCWSMPYYGLQLELTPNYDERTRLTAVMALFSKLTALVTGWTFVTIVFVGTVAQGDADALADKPGWVRELGEFLRPTLSALAGDFAGEKPLVTGMKLMCWLIAVMILVLGILPAIFVKERYYAKEAVAQAKEPFWRSVKDSLRCGPLWALISASFFLVMGYSAIGSLGQYVNIYHVCDGDMLKAGAIGGIRGMVIGISGIAMLPLFTWLGERFDKRTMVLCMLGLSMLGHASNYWLMTPEHPYWQIVSGLFEASAVGAVWMFLPSMKADVADHDELSTRRRREGAINAFYSWFIKASLTASMGISGVVLAWTGFSRDLPKQPPEVIAKMFHVYLWLPVSIWVLALVSIWFYPLTRARCTKLRATLEARRGAV